MPIIFGRLAVVAATAWLLGGCSDPDTRQFPAEAEVVIRGYKGAEVRTFIGEDRGQVMPHLDVPSGTRAVVTEDRPAKPPVQPALRFVKVRLADGANKGTVVNVSRMSLEAAP
jgi:hypothetical protein